MFIHSHILQCYFKLSAKYSETYKKTIQKLSRDNPSCAASGAPAQVKASGSSPHPFPQNMIQGLYAQTLNFINLVVIIIYFIVTSLVSPSHLWLFLSWKLMIIFQLKIRFSRYARKDFTLHPVLFSVLWLH